MTTLQVSRAPHEHAPAGRRCRQWLSVPPGKAVQRTRNPRITLGSLEPDQGQNSSASLGWDQAGSAGNKEEEGREVGSASFAFQAPSSPQAPVPGNHSRSKLCCPGAQEVLCHSRAGPCQRQHGVMPPKDCPRASPEPKPTQTSTLSKGIPRWSSHRTGAQGWVYSGFSLLLLCF